MLIGVESSLLTLLIVLAFGLVAPKVLKGLHLPFISVLILAGALFGPHGLGYVQNNDILAFFGFLGMTFLMLMAGLETRTGLLMKNKGRVLIMALLNGGVPFMVGFFITYSFGYSILASFLIGIVFISSSVAVIVPTLQNVGAFGKREGQLILSAVLVTDVVSLISLGIILQKVQPITHLPFFIYIPLLLISIFALFFIIPKLADKGIKLYFTEDTYEARVRFIFVLTLAILLYFAALGVHPILGAFLAGLVFSSAVHHLKQKDLRQSIHTLGYGIFIPIFFFIIGTEMDFSLFFGSDARGLITILLVFGLIVSKVVSGFIAAKIVGFKNKAAKVYGTISMTQLTTTLATTYAAASLGILDSLLVTSIILISIVTTILSPVVVNLIVRK